MKPPNEQKPLLSTPRMLAVAGVIVALIAVWGAVKLFGAPDEPLTSGGQSTVRRLSEAQYKRSIDDIFGDLKIPGRFDPPLREDGLLAIGNSKAGVTASSLEQYVMRSREIAAQVLSDERRKSMVPCVPRSASAFDESCASQFLAKYGRLLFRRPLTNEEMASLLKQTRTATETAGDFYKGLDYALSGLLVSPAFIFRIETTVHDPDRPGMERLDDYSLAARISFFLWNAPPDAQLLDAAASGALRRKTGLEQQVDRMIASPRFAEGVRAFFSDMFAYDQFDGLAKDQSLFPRFSSKMNAEVKEQSLRTIVDLLVTQKADYRDLFTTKKTFVDRGLASLFKVEFDSPDFDGWMPYTFDATDPHAGLLTLPAFLMLDPAHEGRSSPTIRGKMVRELLLCQTVPAPPGNVDFKAVQETGSQIHPTARDRLQVHRVNATCAGCHALTDPIGLGLENFDAIGQFRKQENGAVIDASGTFENKPFQDAITLQRDLTQSPALPNCLVKRMYEYGVGRTSGAGEREWMKRLEERFAQDEFELPALMRRIATSRAFQAVKPDMTSKLTANNFTAN